MSDDRPKSTVSVARKPMLILGWVIKSQYFCLSGSNMSYKKQKKQSTSPAYLRRSRVNRYNSHKLKFFFCYWPFPNNNVLLPLNYAALIIKVVLLTKTTLVALETKHKVQHGLNSAWNLPGWIQNYFLDLVRFQLGDITCITLSIMP